MKTLITSKLCICFFVLSSILGTANLMAQPANDLIENAIDLAFGPIIYNEMDVNFPGATSAGDGGQQGCGTGVAGIWYKFTATASGEIGAGITNDSTPIVVFYTAPNEEATSGQELTHGDQPTNPCENSNFATIQTTIGITYYIFMKNLLISDVIINTGEIFAAPPNDLIQNAIDLNGLEDYTDPNVHFLMATSSDDNGQNGCDTQSTQGVWYKFTADVNGQVVAGISIDPSNGAIIFYSAPNENATSGTELTHVNQPTNACGPGNLSSIIAEAGTTYYIITGTNEGKASVSVNLSGILGVSENTIEGFSFYPNPVTNEINLNAKSIIDEVTIFNLVGQQVASEKIGSTHRSIDLSHLNSGFYVMNVSSEGISESFKIVKK